MGALEANRRHDATTISVASEVNKGIRDVLAERLRQIEEDGWNPEFEDAHDGAELAEAAACYVLTAAGAAPDQIQMHWPWDGKWWKPADPRQSLVMAGAFILAELDRLDRVDVRFDVPAWTHRCKALADDAGRRCGASHTMYTKLYSGEVRIALSEVPVGVQDRAIEIARTIGDYLTEDEIGEVEDALIDGGSCVHGLDPDCCPCGCGER